MKRNTLTTAVVAGLTGMAGMVSVSNAVNVSPDGTGQVLLYPYYSARGGNDTLVSIVNSTNRGKAVKIRFREAINSRDVLDFPIYLSAYDVWTGAVTATEAGGAKILTTDTTCTVPYIFGDSDGEAEFLSRGYDTAEDEDAGISGNLDGGPTGIERTASGYIEVIEMGSMQKTPAKKEVLEYVNGSFTGDLESDNKDAYLAWAVEHSDGVPNDCDTLVNAWSKNASGNLGGYWADGTAKPNDSLENPTGGLYGAASIINVADGTMFSYNATAIDNFLTSKQHPTKLGTEKPNLISAGRTTFSNVFYDQGDTGADTDNDAIGEDEDNNPDVVKSSWVKNLLEGSNWTTEKGGDYGPGFPSLLALNAALTASSISNEFTVDPAAGAHTEWVVTMPTKRFHVDTALAPLTPFDKAWGKKTASCDGVSLSYWDREEQAGDAEGVVPPVFSPAPQVEQSSFELCREVNVIRFAADDSYPDSTEILQEPKRSAPFGYSNVAELKYTEGWAQASMDNKSFGAKKQTSAKEFQFQRNAYTGLPVIGFAVTSYTNGNVGDGVLANYGGTFQHRVSRTIASSS